MRRRNKPSVEQLVGFRSVEEADPRIRRAIELGADMQQPKHGRHHRSYMELLRHFGASVQPESQNTVVTEIAGKCIAALALATERAQANPSLGAYELGLSGRLARGRNMATTALTSLLAERLNINPRDFLGTNRAYGLDVEFRHAHDRVVQADYWRRDERRYCVLELTLDPDYGFAILNTWDKAPVTGSGDIAYVPGMMEAIAADLREVAARNLAHYTAT